MWDPPGPGLEPVSPALAGGLLSTAPPGKPNTHYFCPTFLAIITYYSHKQMQGRPDSLVESHLPGVWIAKEHVIMTPPADTPSELMDASVLESTS